jgi:hypothetical protein
MRVRKLNSELLIKGIFRRDAIGEGANDVVTRSSAGTEDDAK